MITTRVTHAESRKRVAAARSDMILDEPFFGALALRLILLEDYSALEPMSNSPSMWTDGKHLGYHPDFVTSVTMAELKGVIKHEVLHCSNGHPWRRDAREPVKWNCAADFAINPIVLRSGAKLPQGCLVDKAYDGKSAEWIYDRLPPQFSQKQQGGAAGQGATGAGKAGGQTPQAGGSNGGQGAGAPVPPRLLGEVRDAPTKSDAEAEGAAGGSDAVPSEEDWRQATIQAATIAKGQGKLPADLERFVEQVAKPKIDWRSVLRRFVQQVAKSDYSFVKPNPRYVAHGAYLPALHSHTIGAIAIGIDTSGSVDAVLLGQFEAEIRAIADEVKPSQIHAIYCDARVNRVEVFEQGEEVRLKPCGGGGTDFRPVFAQVAKMDEPPVAIIYLTDLYGTFPQSDPGIPTLWVTPENDDRDQQVPFGELVVAS